MITNSFVFNSPIEGHYQTKWQAPSNIALIKYWGKHGQQLPQNPSLSFTLSKCVTTTAVSFSPRRKDDKVFDFLFEKKKQVEFHPKINEFLDKVIPYFSWIRGLPFVNLQSEFFSPQ